MRPMTLLSRLRTSHYIIITTSFIMVGMMVLALISMNLKLSVFSYRHVGHVETTADVLVSRGPLKSAPVDQYGNEISQHVFDRNSGRAFYNLAKRDDVRLILELGTGLGDGFSLAFGVGLKETGNGGQLITVEHFATSFIKAKQTLYNLPVYCMLGSTVPVEMYLKPDEIPNEWKSDGHFDKFYARDIEIAKDSSQDVVLDSLCRHHKFDVVLIDGNEYTGWAEFLIVSQVCKPKYLLLHDVGTLKTLHVSAHMEKDKSYTLMKKGIEEHASAIEWSIFIDSEQIDGEIPEIADDKPEYLLYK